MLNPSGGADVPVFAAGDVQPLQPLKPRIFLADDHFLVMETLSVLLAPDFDVVGVASEGHSIVDEIVRLQPDVIVLDITMPSVSGLDLCRAIRENAPRTKVVFLTMHTSVITVREAFRAGASAYVVKSCGSRELVSALKTVLDGGTHISAELEEALAKQETDDLSERQVAVLRLVAQGLSAKQIAFKLNISSRTAEFHKNSIMGKLKLRTTAQLTKWALEHGLTS
jgi:DNA-binding NarL/FixJ family response regulator